MKIEVNRELLEELSIADLFAIRQVQISVIENNPKESIFREPAVEILMICNHEIDDRINDIFKY